MEEKDFKKLMGHSKLEIQFPDFEENVMESIRKKEASEKSVWKNIRLSWFFLLVGIVLGLIATNILAKVELQYFGENSNLVLFGIEILVVLIIASQFDNLIRITFRRDNK